MNLPKVSIKVGRTDISGGKKRPKTINSRDSLVVTHYWNILMCRAHQACEPIIMLAYSNNVLFVLKHYVGFGYYMGPLKPLI